MKKTTLGDALRLVDLQPGQTYREKVNGWTVEVRVLLDTPTPGLDDVVMMQPWVKLPFCPSRTISVELGRPQLPKPFVLDESDLAPE